MGGWVRVRDGGEMVTGLSNDGYSELYGGVQAFASSVFIAGRGGRGVVQGVKRRGEEEGE